MRISMSRRPASSTDRGRPSDVFPVCVCVCFFVCVCVFERERESERASEREREREREREKERERDLETAAVVVDVPMRIPPEIRMLAELEEEGRRRHHQNRPCTQKLMKSCRHIIVWDANDGLEASSLLGIRVATMIDRISVERDLISVSRDLISVKRDLLGIRVATMVDRKALPPQHFRQPLTKFLKVSALVHVLDKATTQNSQKMSAP